MFNLVTLESVDYLVIGHVSNDKTLAGFRLGGTVAYSALTAKKLGLRVGVVTSSAEVTSLDIFDDIPVVTFPAEHTTSFENLYDQNGRKQLLHHQAARISLADVPAPWQQATIVHLGPIAQEVDAILPASFSPSLLGLTPQGWMRTWDANGRVTRTAWESAKQALGPAGAVVLSLEDVGGDEEQIEFIAQHTRILAVTEGAAGSRLYWHGDQRRFRAPQMHEIDATGAGDIYAAAFFIRLHVTRDPWEAARFATQLASRSVTRSGLDGIPTVQEIQECMVEVFL